MGLADETGMPYLENEVLIQIEKAKPKGVATRGITSLYLDWRRNRYYEDLGGKNSYAFQHGKILKENNPDIIQPNFEFDNPIF